MAMQKHYVFVMYSFVKTATLRVLPKSVNLSTGF
jgi:hypothetical protein